MLLLLTYVLKMDTFKFILRIFEYRVRLACFDLYNIKEILSMNKSNQTNCIAYICLAIVCLIGTILVSSSQAQSFIWQLTQ